MRLANIQGRATVFVDGAPVDVADASRGQFGPDLPPLFSTWAEFTRWAASLGAVGGPTARPDGLGPPSPSPGQVFAIGLNYRDHAAEAGFDLPDFPHVFTKFPSCIVGPDEPVTIVGDTLDWEVELVVVIGRRARAIGTNEDPWDYVAGVTVGQDFTDRHRQLAGPAPQFSMGKSFPGYGPTGPWLVTPDELADRDDLEVTCSVNGSTVQKGRTAAMVFPIPELLRALSKDVVLQPGDLVFTGTPAGVGHAAQPPRYLAIGDEVHSDITAIGSFTTQIGDTN